MSRYPAKLTWTANLAQAVLAVAQDQAELPHRGSLLTDVRSRAREFARLQPGYVFEQHQVEYAICLLQRLQLELPSHKAFSDAWDEAYQAAKAR